ncbi:Proton glutamate symport protein [Vibrio aerogenes CECT 7868]|uniref:Proton glutamate symport protein n=1 Tax=Vibrio aerogenes CECT 7868 TaxID=1216006 RepID=A0A1M5YVG5_9VIBR|nr:dicarboxylate/amino acid:cation symporter [Vibrio aerogenes]SHI16086.1 Proton glutamate symport protein [Vibrio aerogenes CECT 7868]
MKKMKLTTKIFVGLAAGILVGLLLQDSPAIANTYIKPVGTLFINLIKMLIVPLVFSSLIVGAASIGDIKTLGRIGGKTLSYYLLTTAFAVTIGLVLSMLLTPGAGLSMPVTETAMQAKSVSLADTFLNIIPKNPLKGLVEGNMLQIIAFALFLGMGATSLPAAQAKPFISFFESLAEIMYKITGFVMSLAPYGVFGLIVPVVASNGTAVLLPLIKVIGAVYVGCLLQMVFVYAVTVNGLSRVSLSEFLKGILPAAATAFSTSSSSGTLPVSIKTIKENFGVSDRIASFVLPLGATINMGGTSLYQGVCAIFIAQVYGIDLSFAQMGTIVLTATLGAIGTAGVPGGGLIMLSIVLSSVGLPLDGLTLIAGIDRILDMARTSINVIGDLAAAIVVGSSEKEIGVVETAQASIADDEQEVSPESMS